MAATGKPFLDDATTVLNAALMQGDSGYAYYDLFDKLDMDSVKPAFDTATQVISADLSAHIQTLSAAWDAALSTDAFAATLCPQWELGYIASKLPGDGFTGQWDVADLPGPGGNMGGSFFTLPNEGTPEQQQAGWEFIQWLLEPEQQLAMMTTTGTLSAQTGLLEAPEVKDFTNETFNNAPYGDIFAKSILAIPGTFYMGPNNLLVRTAVENVLNDIQDGNIAVADAWDAAIAAAEAADAAQ